MSRIPPLSRDQFDHDLKLTIFNHTTVHSSLLDNMKSTLAHSHLALDVYLQWYPLYASLEKILGNRLAYLYAYAISEASNSVVCSMIFRKMIIDGGEEPEHLQLTSEEQLIFDFGDAIARLHGNIPDRLYRWVSIFFTDEEMVLLVAFAGQMIASSVFNNVVQTELDETLIPYLPFTVAF